MKNNSFSQSKRTLEKRRRQSVHHLLRLKRVLVVVQTLKQMPHRTWVNITEAEYAITIHLRSSRCL